MKDCTEPAEAPGAGWRRELDTLFAALTFLTRLPAPSWARFHPDLLQRSARYYSWVGLLLGGLHAGLYVLLLQLWSPLLAVLLSGAALVWLTGAFHEDGFADFCDGFGGGWQRDQVLTIMKDSRIGSYGSIGLVSLLAIKWTALASLPPEGAVMALLLGHCWSRWFTASLLMDLTHVRSRGGDKPLATTLSPGGLAVASLPALLLWALPGLWTGLALGAVLVLLRWRFRRYLLRRIGGHTGDCLGAFQQLAEVTLYLVLAAQPA